MFDRVIHAFRLVSLRRSRCNARRNRLKPAYPTDRREARRWLAIVEENINVATAAARLPRPGGARGASAYHLQQAAEKLVKTLLGLAGEPFRRSHDLDDLVARLLPVYPQFAPQAEAAFLSRPTPWRRA